jgi:hypothetical protein
MATFFDVVIGDIVSAKATIFKSQRHGSPSMIRTSRQKVGKSNASRTAFAKCRKCNGEMQWRHFLMS